MVLASSGGRDALINERVGSRGANKALWTLWMCFDGSAGTDKLESDRGQAAGGIVACSGLGKTAVKVKFTLSRNSFSLFARLSL